MKIRQEVFGQLENRNVDSFTLVNNRGMEVTCINYGCIITKIMVPDQKGHFENVVLGHDSLTDYLNDSSFLGAVVGRVGGRIKGASFCLDGKTFTLAKNENNNHLHGGEKGFNKVIWNTETFETNQEAGVQFTYLSPDGEEGYPGNVEVQVTYTLNNENELIIRYSAISDQKTLLTLTNHSYFNLSGDLKRDILGHTLKIKSEQFVELDDEFIPTGNLVDVKDTVFDFTQERIIHSGVDSNHPQIILVGNGYDHPFVLNDNHDEEIVLSDLESGRNLMVETDEAAVVVYSGNSLSSEGEIRGVPSRKYLGICLETQGLPDAIHHPEFPSVVLDKGQQYESVTKYRFGVTKKE